MREYCFAICRRLITLINREKQDLFERDYYHRNCIHYCLKKESSKSLRMKAGDIYLGNARHQAIIVHRMLRFYVVLTFVYIPT